MAMLRSSIVRTDLRYSPDGSDQLDLHTQHRVGDFFQRDVRLRQFLRCSRGLFPKIRQAWRCRAVSARQERHPSLRPYTEGRHGRRLWLPPLLPALPGIELQPVEHGLQRRLAVTAGLGIVAEERSRRHPVRENHSALAGPRPGAGNQAGGNFSSSAWASLLTCQVRGAC